MGEQLKCTSCCGETNIPTSGNSAEAPEINLCTPEVEVKCSTCDICNSPAMCRCTECEETYCIECSSLHQKMKVSREHHLIDFECLEVKPKTPSRRCCGKHPTDEISLYCTECEQLICVRCKVSEHDKHTAKDISDIAKEIRSQLSKSVTSAFIQSTHARFSGLAWLSFHGAAVGNDYETRLSSKVEDKIAEIGTRMKIINSEIEKSANRLIDQLRNCLCVDIDQLRTMKEQRNVHQKDLQSLLDTAKRFTETADDLEIIKSGIDLKKQIESKVDIELPFSTYESKVEHMLGKELTNADFINDVLTLDDSRKIQKLSEEHGILTHKLSFKITGSDDVVRAVVPVSNDTAWIAFNGKSFIYLVDSSGNILRNIDVKTPVDDIVLDNAGNIYVSCPVKRRVKTITPDLNSYELKYSSSKCPRGLAVWREKELLMCLTEEPSWSNSVQGHPGRLSGLEIMKNPTSKFSEHERIYMFKYPVRVAASPTGDMCISDNCADTITVIDGNRKRNTYIIKGPPSTECEAFRPFGLGFDRMGCIVVANNSFTPGIDIFDSSGKFIRHTTLTYKNSVVSPVSLAFDKSGCLWVGLESGEVSVYQYNQ